MKSIGIWYELVGQDLPELELHINLWNLKNDKKKAEPFIDFGIGINDFRSIKTLTLLFPFVINEKDIVDLYKCVRVPDTARLIFNEIECEISSKDRYSVIDSANFASPKLLINIKNCENLENFINLRNNYNETTSLSIDFEELKKDTKFSESRDLYFRFRLTGSRIKEALFCPVHKKNWFLESGFLETQIVDVKINRERNLPHDICKEYRLKKYVFANFNKIHMLVMSDTSDEVEPFGNAVYDCRKLEEHDWDNYLINGYNVTNILAYHWKEKAKKEGNYLILVS